MQEGYCSWCLQKVQATVVDDCVLQRDLLQCNNCGKRVVRCRACSNFAKWDSVVVGTPGNQKRKQLKHQFCAEHQHEIPNFETADSTLDSPDQFLTVYGFASPNLAKASKVVGISLGSAAVFGRLAFWVAPAIGGALGVAMGYSGAVATNVGLATLGGGALAAGGFGMAGGAITIGGTGALLGGGLGAFVSSAYMRSLEGFSIDKIRDGRDPALLTINGFLTEGDAGHNGWQELADRRFNGHAWYQVNWASKNLEKLGRYTTGHTTTATMASALTVAAQSASKVAAKTVGPAATAYQALQLSKNPWHVSFVQAEHTGIVLADILKRCNTRSFVIVGHSLGARVAACSIRALSETDYPGIREVHLIAGATDNGADFWSPASKSVEERLVNYTCANDMVLKTLYKVGTFFISNPIGVQPIDVPGVVNIDISQYAKGHTDCKKKAADFLA